MSQPDQLYQNQQPHVVDFAFDARVAEVFPDMLQRSVPGYATGIALLGVIAERYWQRGTRIYDLGCSLGAATLAMHARLGDAPAYVCVDNAAPMVEKCRQNLHARLSPKAVRVVCADVQACELSEASVVVLNLTLQFIPRARRAAVLRRINRALLPRGVLVLGEKLATDATALAALHEQFKRANGYSELEISQKRTALERVMQLDSEAVHLSRLSQVGFDSVERWFQCLNFSSYLARK